jgi:sugar fermentation stimulation protein A
MLWRWPTPLVEGRLVRRYERFVAEVRVGRELLRAHCVNPGRMEGLVIPGSRVWLSEAPGRALPWTWELAELDGRLVGANTSLPNKLVGAALTRGLLREFREVRSVKAEQPMGRHHRVDFVVNGEHLVEVKNCHLVYPDARGYFPDSASARATSHAQALARRAKSGTPCSIVFTVQRDDVEAVRPSALHDAEFTRALRAAGRAGVRMTALRLRPTLEGIEFVDEVPVELAPYDVGPLAAWSAGFDETSGWVRKGGGVSGRTVARGAG